MTTNSAKKPSVRLSGQDGNVFMLIGLCLRAARKAKWDNKKIDEVSEYLRSATSYDNALQRMMEHFEVE